MCYFPREYSNFWGSHEPPSSNDQKLVDRVSTEDAPGLPGWLDVPTAEQPIPASIFHSTVQRLNDEIEGLRRELAVTHAELAQARADLGRVLLILEAQHGGGRRLWEGIARVILVFAEDSKVRLMLVGGIVLLLLVLAGVGGLSWQDGTLTISPTDAPAR